MADAIFGDVPVFLVGAFAAAAYAPERYTKDIGSFVAAEHYEDAQARLRAGEWKKTRTLAFSNATLGLHGSAWGAARGRSRDRSDHERAALGARGVRRAGIA
jgi:hypothetical protein